MSRSSPSVRRRQWRFVAGTLGAATLLFVYPPWHAVAVRSVTRYAQLPGVEPSIILDTVRWELAFAPRYAPPRSPFHGTADPRERDSLLRAADRFERRYHVPEILRSSGALWRDSVLGSAGIPSISVYDVAFTVDGVALALRLTVVMLLATVAYYLSNRRAGSDSRNTRRAPV